VKWKGHVLVSSPDASRALAGRAAREGARLVARNGDHHRVAARYQSFVRRVAVDASHRTLLKEYGMLHGLTPAEQRVLELAPWIGSSLICETLGKTDPTVSCQAAAILAKTGEDHLKDVVISALAYARAVEIP